MKQRSRWVIGAWLVAIACTDDASNTGAPDAPDASTATEEDTTRDAESLSTAGSGGRSAAGGTGGAAAPSEGGATDGGRSTSGAGGTANGATGATGTAGNAGTGGSGEGGAGPTDGAWSLVWSDEFDGFAIDPSRWEHEVNCWGGGNGEDQCYVADAKNSFVQDGMLHIVALADSPSGAIGGPGDDPTVVTKGHSSARLRTKNRGDFLYGRIEARLRLPFGQGLWPAFWMLPTDEAYGGWAASGEIDIMEAVNLAPDNNEIHGTLHYGGPWPQNVNSGESFTVDDNAWENFHVYAVQWQSGEIRWYVDDTHYATQTEWYSTEAPYPAPFDRRFHLLLNVAVGGAWPGPPNSETTFPQEMVVDYVRVYECSVDPTTGRGCEGS